MSISLSGSLLITGSLTATSTLTAQTLVVQTVTSSIVYSSGSNIFGNSLTNTQQMTGSLRVTGSLSLNNIAIPTSASLASTYLPLAGGTLTGALSGTSATFSSDLSVINTSNALLKVYSNTTSSPIADIELMRGTNTTWGADAYTDYRIRSSGGDLLIQSGESTVTSTRLTIASTGAATFSSSVQATAMSVGVTPTSNILYVAGENNTYDGTIRFGQRGYLQHRDSGNTITSLANDYNSDSAKMEFRMKGNATSDAKMTILGSGNVGIGTNSPNIIGFTGTMLTVNGTGNYQGLEIATSGTSRMTMTVDSSNTYGIISTRQTGMYLIFEVGAASEAMRINPSKQIGINSANTSARLNMTFGGAGQNGFSMLDGDNTVNATFIDFKNSSGTIIGSVSRAGGTNAVTYNTTSDYRLKEDLKDFNGLDKVSAIKVYDFRWKGTNERTDGVIAHELSEVLPYAVHGEKDRLDGDNNPLYQGVDYSKIVPVLVKAIQELKAENDTLKEILQRNNIQ